MRGSVVKRGNGYSVVVELDRDRLARNPADTADPPRAPGKHAAMVTWDATETARFLTAVQDDRLYAAFLLLATTGARRGEVLGLCWSDVDLGTGRAAIRQTVITVNNEAQIGEPKTARGRRTIDLDAGATLALAAGVHPKVVQEASVTPISASRWTPTATSRRAFTPGPRSRSPR